MFKALLVPAVLVLSSLLPTVAADDLASEFARPPQAARPWVYWFWLNGNITKTGITADLEAMKRVGIGGVLIMEVDQGAPVGPVPFMSDRWREMFQHAVAEAKRLGLEVNMNNDAGWNGSGGPWIKPEQSMQEVVWTETEITGPKHFEAVLPRPQSHGRFLSRHRRAGSPERGRLPHPDFESKAAYQTSRSAEAGGRQSQRQCSSTPRQIVDLTARMDGRRPPDLGRAGRQVDDPPPRPHQHRQRERARAGERPRPGVRQAEQGGHRGELRGHDGEAHAGRRRSRPARRSSPRTSIAGKTARRTGRRGCGRSSGTAAATT